jgi:transcriptional regulator with GAF, ATPase, and Fis domain
MSGGQTSKSATLQLKKPTALSMTGARLLVQKGPDRGRALHLSSQNVVIGSSESADLTLTDPTVSRHHLRLSIMSDGYLVTDLDSTNGTRLHARRIRTAYMEPEDVLQLGDTRVKLERIGDAVELSLSAEQSFGRLVGKSVSARRLFAELAAVAASDVTVLLEGETGTGKDAAAGAIHEASARAPKPFVVVDCASIPASLIESELFGHERGAFTGAVDKRVGAFVAADQGTLFLDEIGELPRELQPRLLRALENREVKPVGASRPIAVDVRVIAATNRDLAVEVNRGQFRDDLFYRLNVATIRVPPLRDRPEDIPLLAERFRKQLGGDDSGRFSTSHLLSLTGRSWPGNVRELRNWVERQVLLGRGDVVEPGAQPSFSRAKAQAVEAFERAFLTALMLRAGGNVSEAARLAAMDRVYLSRLLRKYQISR